MFPDADFTVVWEIPLESQLEDSYLYYFVSQKCQKKGEKHLFTDTVGSCTALTAVEKGRPEKGSLKSCVNGVNREGMSKRRAVIPLKTHTECSHGEADRGRRLSGAIFMVGTYK